MRGSANSARGFLDDESIEIPCPACGRRVKTTVGAGRRSPTIQCPGGHTINVEGSGFDREVIKAEKAVEDLLEKFR